MASISIHIFTVAVIISVAQTQKVFVSLQCNNNNMGQVGEQTMLECVIKTAKGVDNVEIRVVTWKKGAVSLLVFNENTFNEKPEPGYEFAVPSWNERNMNVSLLITNTAIKDNGSYSCMVMTDSGDAQANIELSVSAKYNQPTVHSIPEKLTPNTNAALICDAEGGYPAGQIRWFDEHNGDWTKSSKMDVEKMEDGLFHLSSKLTLLQGSTYPKYTCVVYNASGGKEAEVPFVIEYTPEKGGLGGSGDWSASSKIVAPLVVIGSLITGLLVALLVYRRRNQQARRHSTAPLMGDHREVPRLESFHKEDRDEYPGKDTFVVNYQD